MGVNYNTRIITNGLVMCVDASNQKSLNIPTQADHGYADWYCLASGTALYSIVNSTGGTIYENNNGTITALVTATTPQRGTINITAGRTYYGDVPINIIVEDQHHSIAPLTMMGTQFWNIAVRGNPSTYYVYSPYQAATVNFYDNTTGGLTGTPTSTLSLSAGQSGTFASNNLTNHWISSNVPVLATATQTSLDKTILSPMTRYVYQRYISYNKTTNSTTPTNVTNYVVYDSTYNVMAMNIGDGAGSDCAQGLGLEYLSDTYSFGTLLSDYAIAAPYDGTVITTYYWSGSAWIAWDSHTLNGTITSPAYVRRDGSAGPGVDGGTISGVATNMASGATLWKWEGNNPFYLCINDSVDDEFSVLGWSRARISSPRSGVTWNDLSGSNNNGTLSSITYAKSTPSDYIAFSSAISSGVSLGSAFDYTSQDFSFSYWVYLESYTTSVANQGPIPFYKGSYQSKGYYSQIQSSTPGAITFVTNQAGALQSSGTAAGAVPIQTWKNVTITRSGASVRIYVNGVDATVTAGTHVNPATSTDNFVIGYYGSGAGSIYGNMRISCFSGYSVALTAQQVLQNFNALRGRFGV